MEMKKGVVRYGAALILTLCMIMTGVAFVMSFDASYAAKDPYKPKVATEANKITVTWKKVKGVKKYQLQCKKFYSKKKFKKVKTLKKTTWTFKQNYCTRYKIRIKGIGKKTTYSKPIEFETGSNPSLAYERVLSLPSHKINKKYTANGTDGHVFVGQDLWYLKSARTVQKGSADYPGYFPMSIGVIRNFASFTNTQNAKVQFKAVRYPNRSLYYGKHASSITYHDGSFYIVTCGSPSSKALVIEVGTDGIIKREITAKGFNDNTVLSTIAFYGESQDGKPMFICRDGKSVADINKGERHRFTVATLDDTVLRKNQYFCTSAKERDVFTMTDSGGKGLHCNDIDYDPETKTLYHSVFVYKGGHKIQNNWIYAYKVDPYGTFEREWTVLNQISNNAYHLSTTKSSETDFEIEGIDVYDGKVYISVNTDGVEDALYMIK